MDANEIRRQEAERDRLLGVNAIVVPDGTEDRMEEGVITRSCAVCGSKKTGDEAEIKPGEHDQFWKNMHLPGCAFAALKDAPDRFHYFADNGSPLSSVLED